MKFTQEHKDGDWTADVEFRGRTIQVRVDPVHNEAEISTLAVKMIARIDAAWPLILTHIANSLHHAYNETWSDPDQGFPMLDREAFLQKIQLSAIWLMDERDAVSLLFDDCDLFGGHSIEISCDPDGTIHKPQLYG